MTTFRFRDAEFSPDRSHRLYLRREWTEGPPLVAIGLNPSIAGADIDDATIVKLFGFASRWGCGSLTMLNAATYVATDPKDLLRAKKSGVTIVDADNDRRIALHATEAHCHGGIVLPCWGGRLGDVDPYRQLVLWELIRAFFPRCLGFNKDRSPVHPLYIPYERPLVAWTPFRG